MARTAAARHGVRGPGAGPGTDGVGASLHQVLWERCAEEAARCLSHPFVRGLADGSLPEEAFRAYVAQDAFFLRAFLRAYALVTARAPDLETAAALVDLQRATLRELDLHASYARTLDIDLVAVRPYRATSAYCDFLLRTAWQEPPGLTIAALTPCMRLYRYLGTELARGASPSHRYADWIRAYSGAEFGTHVESTEALLDRMAQDTREVEEAYRYAMRCEHDFFTAPLEARE